MIDSLEEARRLDAEDPLAGFRERFALPPGVIYLDGNSLGALPRQTPDRLFRTVGEEWGKGLIRSWNDAGWIDAPARVGAKIARLIGAGAHEVMVADSTSVNLYKLLAAATARIGAPCTILSEPGNFPTDLYIAQGLARTDPSITVRVLPRERIVEAADERTVVLLTHVHYKSGERFDMAAVTRAVQARGATILWDLSHSTGAVELDLTVAGADLAVGCGYKYLNGGPGAPAFLYVAERHQAVMRSPMSGWMGHASPFAFGDDYEPARDLRQFLCGTPQVLGLAALESGVDLMLEADKAALAAKSARQCDLFIALVEQRCAGFGLTLLTPRAAAARGSHVSFAHPDGYPVMQALIARGVIGDFRDPDVMRFGLAPLYNGYADVWSAVDTLREVLTTRAWDDPRLAARAAVT